MPSRRGERHVLEFEGGGRGHEAKPVRIARKASLPSHADPEGFCPAHQTHHELVDLPEAYSVELDGGKEYRLPAAYAVSMCPECVDYRLDATVGREAFETLLRRHWEDTEISEPFERVGGVPLEERVEALEDHVKELEQATDRLRRDLKKATEPDLSGTYTTDDFESSEVQ